MLNSSAEICQLATLDSWLRSTTGLCQASMVFGREKWNKNHSQSMPSCSFSSRSLCLPFELCDLCSGLSYMSTDLAYSPVRLVCSQQHTVQEPVQHMVLLTLAPFCSNRPRFSSIFTLIHISHVFHLWGVQQITVSSWSILEQSLKQ